MKQMKMCVILFAIVTFYSCSDARFVLRMNNEIVKNYKEKGEFTYSGESLVINETGYHCNLDADYERLNSLVINKNYDSVGCLFIIDYSYIERMRSFVLKQNNSFSNELQVLSEEEFIEIKTYYDSIWLENINQ